MREKIVLDTSALMSCKNIIDYFKNDYDIVVPVVVVEELDNLKTNSDYHKSSSARAAIRHLRKNEDVVQYSLNRRIANELLREQCDDSIKYNANDDVIVSCALFTMGKLCTCDLNLRIKAKMLNVNTVDIPTEVLYRGYIVYEFTEDEYNEYYERRSDYFSQYYTNEYIIINIVDTNKTVEYRYDGEDLVLLKLPSSKIIKAKNPLQRCVLDMLNNNNLTVCAVMGTVGSGKTYLSLQMALNAVKNTGKQSKIVGVRSPIGTGKEVGYLKGTFEDKTQMFFYPVVHSLDGGIYEMQKYVDEGVFTTAIPFYMKGCTYNDSIIICDEAEDLTEQELRLVGTRLGENSRIIFSGDYKQSEIDTTSANPLVRMCDVFKGNDNFACICLDDDVRSATSQQFAHLFQS